MLSRVFTGSLYGLESELVTVETDLSAGLPALYLVGLPDLTVKESRERIRSAIMNSGYMFPAKRITVNLAPAGTKKEGSHFDLPIAVGVLASAGEISHKQLKQHAFIGELSLDGRVNPVSGALPLIIGLRRKGIRFIFLPSSNAAEAGMVEDVVLYPVTSLREIMEHFKNNIKLKPYERVQNSEPESSAELDFADVAGQEAARRAVLIGAAANHNLLMIGPPGSGKTMIAKRIAAILPDMTYDESLEVTKIYSIAGQLSEETPMIVKRPFRAPHHSISQAAFIGGGARPRPGEASLAHCGVLFLDELPEFKRGILELLRQPIEDEKIMINRMSGAVTFPSKIMLVAAMNPCPCGFSGDNSHECTCRPAQIETYRSRLSGPLLDRMDIQMTLMPVKFDDLLQEGSSEGYRGTCSAEMKKEISQAREIQRKRYENEKIACNSQLTPELLKRYCPLDSEVNEFLKEAAVKFSFSARACHKVIKVARTIADLEGRQNIGLGQLAEAVRYRLDTQQNA